MIRPRWVLALLAALAVAAGFALLGQWQLERAIASGQVVQRTTEKVRPLEATARPGGPVPQKASGQMVSVAGRFVPGDEQLIEGRLNQGKRGYWVVSHFVTESDAAGIPVARGWAPDARAARSALDTLTAAPDASTVTVTGRFVPTEAPVVPREGADPHSLTTVSVAALINLWRGYTDQPVYAAYIVDNAAPAGLTVIDSPVPEEDVALNWLNVFYAVEWVVFAGFAVFLWYRLVKDAVEREEEEAAQAADRGPAASPPPPGT